MGLGSSQRRKWLRVQLHVNRKLTAIRWIGLVSVGEIRVCARRRVTCEDYVKADKGAEKSFRTRGKRGRRIGKCRRADRQREKVNLAAVDSVRPRSKSTLRSSRRARREQSWLEKISTKFFDLVLSTKFDEHYDWKNSPLATAYGSARLQVELVSSLGSPISFGVFRRQCVDDTPWVADPDMCLRVRKIEDLEWHLLGTNVSISAPRLQPYKGFVKIGSSKKKTLGILCLKCGRRTAAPVEVCECSRVGTGSSKPAANKGRVRRCGCKVGAKCPH